MKKYYLKGNWESGWTEVTKDDWIRAERSAGFRSKFGDDHEATGGFSGGGISGRIEYVEETNKTVL